MKIILPIREILLYLIKDWTFRFCQKLGFGHAYVPSAVRGLKLHPSLPSSCHPSPSWWPQGPTMAWGCGYLTNPMAAPGSFALAAGTVPHPPRSGSAPGAVLVSSAQVEEALHFAAALVRVFHLPFTLQDLTGHSGASRLTEMCSWTWNSLKVGLFEIHKLMSTSLPLNSFNMSCNAYPSKTLHWAAMHTHRKLFIELQCMHS